MAAIKLCMRSHGSSAQNFDEEMCYCLMTTVSLQPLRQQRKRLRFLETIIFAFVRVKDRVLVHLRRAHVSDEQACAVRAVEFIISDLDPASIHKNSTFDWWEAPRKQGCCSFWSSATMLWYMLRRRTAVVWECSVAPSAHAENIIGCHDYGRGNSAHPRYVFATYPVLLQMMFPRSHSVRCRRWRAVGVVWSVTCRLRKPTTGNTSNLGN